MKTIKIGNADATFVANQANTLYSMAEGRTITTSISSGIDATGKVKGRMLDIDGVIDAAGIGVHFGGGYSADAEYATTLEIGKASHVSGSYGVAASGHENILRNAGEITGSQYGLSFDSGTLTLVNSGEITGQVGIVAGLGAEAITIRNSGVISGNDYAIYGGYVGDRSDKIVNSGEINGDILMAGGDDVSIFRSGVVNGTVDGGAGDDTFIFIGGSMGAVRGGEGNDRYVIRKPGPQLYEDSNDGTDRVDSAITWTISDNFETLRLTGKKDINGFGAASANQLKGNSGDNGLYGRAGADTINGGAGKDMLTGDQDSDTFVFTKGTGRDTVMDFEAGIDDIQLGGLKGAKDFADMIANHVDVVGGDIRITYGDDVIVLKDTTEAELHAGDFIF